ncbi:lysoplasmalogenase family protein [Tropicimonas aquimaris]|uniref:Lysoplasmalogenase family protein n=1 Tax=Tropicimonas aquimaris TaxID=914152 RepID=A0ABW3IYK7_9RHOB
MFALAVSAAGFATIYLLRHCAGPSGVARSLTKTLSTGLLAAAALFAGAPVLLVAGLGLGAIGDLLLSRSGARTFLAGLVAFAVAHLAYTFLFLNAGAVPANLIAPERNPAALALLALGIAMGWRLWPVAGALRWPVLVYVGIIVMMGMAALSLPIPPEGPYDPLLAIAAASLFILSDAILAFELFLLPATHRLRRISPYVVWVPYWLAQALFLAAFAGLT